MQNLSVEPKIYEKCRIYLSRSEKSPLQLHNWLLKNGVFKDVADFISKKMEKEGFICQKRYLKNIKSQLLESGYPKSFIQKKLLFKKFSVEEIENCLKDITNKSILEHSSKKKRLEKKVESDILSFYLKRGFSKSDIITHIKEMKSEFPD